MTFVRGFFFSVNLLVAFFSAICFLVSYFLPSGGAMAGFLMLLTPVCMAVNVGFVLYWLFSKPFNGLLSVALLLVAWPLVQRGFTFHGNKERAEEAFSVLSFNVLSCDAVNYVHKGNKENSPKLIKVMASIKSDVKCFQEIYNYDAIEHFRVFDKLKQQNPNYVSANNSRKGFVGLAIFSKFPIVASSFKKFQHANGLLWADIDVKGKTVRVMNVQFYSMGIRVDSVLKKEDREDLKAGTKNIISQLKRGFQKRKKEVDFVLDEIEKSPHPVVLVGDFNELPFGYAYGSIRKRLRNAFEEAGRGFGFTYNRNPKFIRIDNQFFDNKALIINQFKTLDNVPYSDHYPVWGRYEFR